LRGSSLGFGVTGDIDIFKESSLGFEVIDDNDSLRE
jgi:hypothetical protein